jgi:hypothetical protein
MKISIEARTDAMLEHVRLNDKHAMPALRWLWLLEQRLAKRRRVGSPFTLFGLLFQQQEDFRAWSDSYLLSTRILSALRRARASTGQGLSASMLGIPIPPYPMPAPTAPKENA